MKNQSVDYQALEFMVQPKPDKQKGFSFTSTLNQIWNWILESIAVTNEPVVYSRRGKSGSTYWEIYDPLLGRRVFFDSDVEVRAWLDRRYCQ